MSHTRLLSLCRLMAASAALVALTASAPVAAQSEADEAPATSSASEPSVDDVKGAAVAFDAGRAAFKDEEYGVAAEHFERADALVPNAKVLQLAIQSRDLAGQLARAATLAALAGDRYPGDERFADAPRLLARASAELHQLTVTCGAPCSLLLGTRLVPGRPATKRLVFVDAGAYRIRAVFSDEQGETRDYFAEAGTAGALEFAPLPAAAAPVPDRASSEPDAPEAVTQSRTFEAPFAKTQRPPVTPSGLPSVVFWSGVAATGLLVGVSSWSAIDTQKNPGIQKVTEQCKPEEGTSCAVFQEGLRKQSRTNLLWGATAGVGLLTALVGAVWTDWGLADDGQGGADASGRGVTPWVSFGNGAAIGARGRF